MTWTNVRSMFLANNKLYTADTNGNLTRRDWNPATGLPVSGTAVVVSGPSTGDGQDWRARDAFVVRVQQVNTEPMREGFMIELSRFP